MEPEQVNHLDLYAISKDWTRQTRSYFQKWSFDDQVHEAYLASLKILRAYKPERGTLRAYLTRCLLEPVMRQYCKVWNICVKRVKRKGKWQKRIYIHVEKQVHPLPEVECHDPEPVDIPETWTQVEAHLLLLLGKDYRGSKMARILGVSETRVSQIKRTIRSRLRI